VRLFIATPVNIPIYEIIKKTLGKYIDGKWVEGWNLHITHKFIGEDDPKKYKVKIDIPDEPIKIKGTGLFNNKILYLKADVKDLINRQINEKFNLKNDKPFRAHVTLCRIKNIKDKQFFEVLKNFEHISFEIPFEVYLYKSTLTKRGPVYEKIHKY
jgi:2'-5' RNA ligase